MSDFAHNAVVHEDARMDLLITSYHNQRLVGNASLIEDIHIRSNYHRNCI